MKHFVFIYSCPGGASTLVACSPGSYNDQTQSSDSSACIVSMLTTSACYCYSNSEIV